jgi:hypothetical protein
MTTVRPTVTGTVTSYSVTPALPPGLSLNATTGEISGTPTQLAASASYTITASNSSGATSFALALTVFTVPPPAPSGLNYSAPQLLPLNSAMTAVRPTVTGTVTSYSVTPALPPGLSLNATTGEISGTPTQLAASATYRITASNSSGSTSFELALTVFTVTVESSSITRIAATGTSLYAPVVVRPVLVDVGTLYAKPQDATGIILPFVEVSANGDGSFTLMLATNPNVTPNLFAGNATLNLCQDANCATTLASVTVPISINVLGSTTDWPGNNLTVLNAWTDVADWSTFQGNAAHTGHVRASVDPNQFTTRWKIPGSPLSNGWSQLKSNLATANGLFYVVSSGYLDSGVLHARSESDGSEVWRYSFTGMSYPSANPAAVANGVVYLAAGHQDETYMYALNATTGEVVYRATMTSQWEDYLAPTVGPNGMLYANAGTYGGLYGFDPTGNQLFFANQEQQSNWTPAVDATGVYAYTGVLRVHDPLTGTVLHEIADPTFTNYVYEIGGAPVLGAPGSVFAANYTNSLLNGGAIGNTLVNFRTDTNSIGWQQAGVYPTTPAYKDGVVYAVNQNPLRLEARAETDGTMLWWWTPPSPADSLFVSEVLLTDNLAFVTTTQATYAIDLETHRPVFSFPASGKLALSANGVLYIHNATDLVAINLK